MTNVPEIRCPQCGATMPYTAAACPGCKRRMVEVSSRVGSKPSDPWDDVALASYRQCRAQNCGYMVSAQDEYCRNCGIVKPHIPTWSYRNDSVFRSASYLSIIKPQIPKFSAYWQSLAYTPWNHTFLFFLTGVAIFLAIEVAVSSAFSTEPEASLFPILAILVALPIAILVPRTGYKILKYLFHDRQMRREPNLRKSEEVIQQRLQEIEQRIKQIESVRSRIKSETEQWQAVRETLDEVLATLGNHHTRYSTKLMEIELVRWQNKLRPLLTKLEALTYEQADARLKRLEGTIKDGEAMKATLKKQVGASDLTPEARAIAERVEETLASCQKIHEALVGHQAVLALKGVGTLPDTLSPTSLPTDELWKLEVFNIQVSITDFSSSFEELEAEYTRIQTEEQIRDIFEKTAGI